MTEKVIKKSKITAEWATIRPTSIWGPWFDIPYKKFFEVVLKNQFVHPGCRSGTATYGYVGNCVYQIDKILMAERQAIQEKMFYIGDSPPNNLSDWANEIATISGLQKPITVPYFIVKLGALFGDLLEATNIRFPLTSFRLRNMTTDNIIHLAATEAVTGICPFTLGMGIKETLKWINDRRQCVS